MLISWSTAKALLTFFGPLLIPKAIAFYRSLRYASNPRSPIRPLPRAASDALNILFLSAAIFLLSTLPIFHEPNLFHITASRLSTPSSVLFNRLEAIRPLTPLEEALKPKLTSLTARGLYQIYGPHVLADCSWCILPSPADQASSPSSPLSINSPDHLLYALPTLLTPHLLHLLLLCLATARAGTTRFRLPFALASLGLAALELHLTATTPLPVPGSSPPQPPVRPWHWQMHTYRGLALLLLDAALAFLLWATATNRLFPAPPSVAARLELVARQAEQVQGKLGALGVLRNAIARDKMLRARWEEYWEREGVVMGEVVQDEEVVREVRRVMEGGAGPGGGIAELEVKAGKLAESVVTGALGGVGGAGL